VDIKKVLYQTVHKKSISIDEIADAIGCSSSLLYRCANVNDPQARFPVERILPLMRFVKDYSILRHLASRSGFLLYKLPSKIKYNKAADLNRFQSLFTNVFRSLLDLKQGKISKEQCLSQVDEFLGRTIEIRESIHVNDQFSDET